MTQLGQAISGVAAIYFFIASLWAFHRRRYTASSYFILCAIFLRLIAGSNP